jgi:hypothetical protein
MKRFITCSILVVAALALSQCRSPQGNVNPMGFGKSRPNLVQ